MCQGCVLAGCVASIRMPRVSGLGSGAREQRGPCQWLASYKKTQAHVTRVNVRPDTPLISWWCQVSDHPPNTFPRQVLPARELTQIVTPGTVPPDLRDWSSPNYLLAIAPEQQDGRVGLCWADVNTGEVQCSTSADSHDDLADELLRIDPAEVLIAGPMLNGDSELALSQDAGPRRISNGPRRNPLVEAPNARKQLEELGWPASSRLAEFCVVGLPSTWASPLRDAALHRLLDSFFGATEAAWARSAPAEQQLACLMLLRYLLHTQRTSVPRLSAPGSYLVDSHLLIDAQTRQSLEITKTMAHGMEKGSLLAIMGHRKTATAAGSRELRERLTAPLRDTTAISHRLDIVEFFTKSKPTAARCWKLLQQCLDLNMHCQRAAADRTDGLLTTIVPSLCAINRTLTTAAELRNAVQVACNDEPVAAAEPHLAAAALEATADLSMTEPLQAFASDIMRCFGSHGAEGLLPGCSEEIDSLVARQTKLHDVYSDIEVQLM
eukprot:m.176994 g.176994  ORF g.176994 m.176994 type:complete len:494 (-) comp17957_c0_seq6:57-1538(-)